MPPKKKSGRKVEKAPASLAGAKLRVSPEDGSVEVVRHEVAGSVEISRDAKGVLRWSVKSCGNGGDLNSALAEVVEVDAALIRYAATGSTEKRAKEPDEEEESDEEFDEDLFDE